MFPHSIGLSGNQRSSAGRGPLTLDFLYLSDVWLRNSSENRVNNINILEAYHEIRWNLDFWAVVPPAGVRKTGCILHSYIQRACRTREVCMQGLGLRQDPGPSTIT